MRKWERKGHDGDACCSRNGLGNRLLLHQSYDEACWCISGGNYKRLISDERQMRTAIMELVSAARIGTVRISIWSPSQGSQTILLQEVLHIPRTSSTNLISISQLTVKGINISFKRDLAEVFRHGILMAIAKKVNRLYTILTDASVMDDGLLISLKDLMLTTL